MSKNEYYNINDIFNILGITREFEHKCPEFPFNYGADKVKFGWGNIIIPKNGIRKTILNKLKDESSDLDLKEINMMYSIPFIVSDYGHIKGSVLVLITVINGNMVILKSRSTKYVFIFMNMELRQMIFISYKMTMYRNSYHIM